MGNARSHKKPAVSKEAIEAESIAKQMYAALTVKGAPQAHPMGYIMGTCTVLKMLVDQAEQQGSNREELKQYALRFVNEL